MTPPTAAVVGSGPNGLAAAVVLARAGVLTTVYEQASSIGGGARTAELTLPGFRHDLGSAVHPLAVSSGFFRRFELGKRIELVTPDISYAHPLDDSPAAIAYLDLERTVSELGVDGRAWRRLLAPLVDRAQRVARFTGSSLLRVPDDPFVAAVFGLRALEQGSPAWNLRWRDAAAPALLAGVAAHSVRPMPSLSTSGTALALATAAHAGGWPIPVGGSQAIVDALADDLRAHGGSIEAGVEITDIAQVGPVDAVLFDTTPSALVRLVGDALPRRYRQRLLAYRHGDGVAKVDFALNGPVPWADLALRDAPTPHRCRRSHRGERSARRRPVCAGLATFDRRRLARPRGPPRAVELHTRAARLDARPDRGDHPPDRAVGSRISRRHHCLDKRDGDRHATSESELHRRRLRDRRGIAEAARGQAHPVARTLAHAAARGVPVLIGDTARARRARTCGGVCRTVGAVA